MKASERADAIRLRREGRRYRDLTRQFGVAKSTLWRWLKAEGLVDAQSQRYTEQRLLAQRKAAKVVHARRIQKTQLILEKAGAEIGRLNADHLRLIGAALYWAEGSKQRAGHVSAQVAFGNTDPRMLQLFIRFLQECCGVRASDTAFIIYLHETADAADVRTYWCRELGVASINVAPIVWKRHKPTTSRKNVGKQYHGLVRIVVRKSTDLNRRIGGWINGMCNALGSGATVAQLTLDQQIPGSIPGSPAIVYLDNGESFEVRDEQAEGIRVRVAEYGAMTYT